MSQLYARFTSLEGGMNGGFDPAVIAETQYALGINVVSRSGRPSTRPSFYKPALKFASDEDQELFETGRFQGGIVYTPGEGRYAVSVIGGWVFMVNLFSFDVVRMTAVERRNPNVRRCYFCQAENYLIIQDGITLPVILKNQTARVSDRSRDEVPAGTNMAYGHGRIFLQVGSRSFIAGDIHKVHKRRSVIKFTEEEFLSEGGTFSVPAELGRVTGMKFSTHFDTSTGDGPLLVLCENGVSSYAVQNSRLLWPDNDISKVQMIGTGCVSGVATADINQDMMFWSWGGLRSWAAVKQDAVYRRKYTNQSAELTPILKDSTGWLLPYTSMIQFNNRLLFTLVGQKAKCKVPVPWSEDEEWAYEDVSFKCMASLDFDQINNQSRSPGQATTTRTAAYDGIWTGLNPTLLLAATVGGEERAYCFDKDRGGRNRFWQITDDETGLDNGVHPISCELQTRTHVGTTGEYVEQPFIKKRLTTMRLWISGIRSELLISIGVRNDRARRFTKLQERLIPAMIWDGKNEGDEVITGTPQNRSAIPFEEFDEVANVVDNEFEHSGYEMAFSIKWKGYAQISRMLAELHSDGEADHEEEVDKILINAPDDDKYEYRI